MSYVNIYIYDLSMRRNLYMVFSGWTSRTTSCFGVFRVPEVWPFWARYYRNASRRLQIYIRKHEMLLFIPKKLMFWSCFRPQIVRNKTSSWRHNWLIAFPWPPKLNTSRLFKSCGCANHIWTRQADRIFPRFKGNLKPESIRKPAKYRGFPVHFPLHHWTSERDWLYIDGQDGPREANQCAILDQKGLQMSCVAHEGDVQPIRNHP